MGKAVSGRFRVALSGLAAVVAGTTEASDIEILVKGAGALRFATGRNRANVYCIGCEGVTAAR